MTRVLVEVPCGEIGLEGAFVGLQGNIFRNVRLAEFGAFFLNDDLIAFDEVFPFGDKTPKGTRRHQDGHQQGNDDMEPFA